MVLSALRSVSYAERAQARLQPFLWRLHTVTTGYERGWSRTRNGDLLRLADQEMFEVFLTTDQRLKYQQNLTNHQIAIVVLPTTSWRVI
jgi:hypothetical protein